MPVNEEEPQSESFREYVCLQLDYNKLSLVVEYTTLLSRPTTMAHLSTRAHILISICVLAELTYGSAVLSIHVQRYRHLLAIWMRQLYLQAATEADRH
jgi:hypothetical protein